MKRWAVSVMAWNNMGCGMESNHVVYIVFAVNKESAKKGGIERSKDFDFQVSRGWQSHSAKAEMIREIE